MCLVTIFNIFIFKKYFVDSVWIYVRMMEEKIQSTLNVRPVRPNVSPHEVPSIHGFGPHWNVSGKKKNI